MLAPVIRKLSNRLPVSLLKLLGNLWPPYFFSGIRITYGSKDFRHFKVSLNYSWYNKNYVGTQFGGSIYAMTDPFFMMMIINNLGPGYIVWDKAAQIEFIKPGRSRLFAEFKIDETLLQQIRSQTASGDKYIFGLSVEVKDKDGQTIARVIKTIYVRKKLQPSH